MDDAAEGTLRTLASAVRHEGERVRGSRFVADAAPAEDEAAALAVVEAARDEFPDASHHCFAWRLDPAGRSTRAADDGEPGGSAGAPILRRIEGADLAAVCVVVTRWFGGTKLGFGGLVRAYGGAAQGALEAATVVERVPWARLALAFPYPASNAVRAACAAHGAEELAGEYGERVRLVVRVPAPALAAFRAELVERTAGAVGCEPG